MVVARLLYWGRRELLEELGAASRRLHPFH
jgi:hypothetical protein